MNKLLKIDNIMYRVSDLKEIESYMKHLSFRLKPGQFLKEEIEGRTRHVKAGVLLSAVGSLENVSLRMAGTSTDHETILNLTGPFEIVSGTGTISPDGCHIHISVSNSEGNVIGGHLKDECKIATTAEIAIGIFDNACYKRIYDENTGFRELAVE